MELHLGDALVGTLAVALAAVSSRMRDLPLSEPLLPLGLRLRDAVFMGWFGPIGASALFYLTFSVEEGGTDPRVWAVGSLVVAASTVVHGVCSAPGRGLYRRTEEVPTAEATHQR